MKFWAAILLLAMVVPTARSQTNDAEINVNVDDLVNAAQQWAQENLDTNVVTALQNVDQQKVERFLGNLQNYFNSNYVLDLGQLKPAANAVLPLLESRPETRPYAAWLKARLDYFAVAQELQAVTPPPKPLPGTNQPPPINPTFAAERKFWINKVSAQPLPADADRMVPRLKRIFASEHVPPALVWVAEVESDFDPSARSPVGAAGLFQLMPATAKALGLRLWPFDQRKELAPAARAAAIYLRRLHQKFGDWRLAVAAYNCGEGRVEKLLHRYHADSYAAIATHLPAETQMYVPKVEATILHREGVDLEQL